MEPFSVSILGRFFFLIFSFKTSPHLLQLFWRIESAQTFYGQETSPDVPSAGGQVNNELNFYLRVNFSFKVSMRFNREQATIQTQSADAFGAGTSVIRTWNDVTIGLFHSMLLNVNDINNASVLLKCKLLWLCNSEAASTIMRPWNWNSYMESFCHSNLRFSNCNM